MSLFSRFLGNTASGAVNKAEKALTKNLVEAVVSGSLLVSFADGTCEDSELNMLENVLSIEDSFKPWASEFNGLISKYAEQLQKAYRLGKMNALKELADLRGQTENAELVLVCIISVAEANGNIAESEKAVLEEIAEALGLPLKKYLK